MEKYSYMTVNELKLQIFMQVDSMDKSRLEEIYGLFLNFINGQNEIDEWERLSIEQQEGIVEAIKEIESGSGIPHETVMANIRKKYSHAS